MHSLLSFLAASTTPTTTSKGSKSSSTLPFLLIIVAFALVYILFIRPRSQRMRQQQTAGRQLSVGDSVMSAGGIYGTVVALDADVVEVEVAPGVVLNFLRRSISPRPGPPAAPTAQPADEDWVIDSPSDQGPDTGIADLGGPDPDAPS